MLYLSHRMAQIRLIPTLDWGWDLALIGRAQVNKGGSKVVAGRGAPAGVGIARAMGTELHAMHGTGGGMVTHDLSHEGYIVSVTRFRIGCQLSHPYAQQVAQPPLNGTL